MAIKVLVVDDDAAMSRIIKDGLALQGYDVTVKASGEDALKALRLALPDLAIVDVNLGGISGYQFCQLVKGDQRLSTVPIIMLTARGGEKDRVHGLEIGADDYVVKPFSEKELAARVQALLRRTKSGGRVELSLRSGKIDLNLEARELRVAGSRIDITKLEFDLLRLLMEKRNVHTYAALAEGVWGDNREATSHTIAVAVGRLRNKLGNEGKKIEAVPGVGYRFSD